MDAGWDAGFVGRSPWLWPLGRAAGALGGCAEWPSWAELDAVYDALTRGRELPALRFGPNLRRGRRAGEVVVGELYDGRIALQGVVPTRIGNWHDLLNALCFATWPNSKHALHARQCRLLQARIAPGATRLPPARSAEQDALTLFDEGGVVIAAWPDAAAALQGLAPAALPPRLQALAGAGRARVVPFGHALLEHLVTRRPCPGASAHVLTCSALPDDGTALLRALDAALAARLQDPRYFNAPAQALHLRLDALADARLSPRRRNAGAPDTPPPAP